MADREAECLSIVAAYLRRNGFAETLTALTQEAGLSALSLETTVSLEELIDRHLSARLVEEDAASEPSQDVLEQEACPPWPTRVTKSLMTIHATNVLSVVAHDLPRRTFDTSTATYKHEHIPCFVTTAADKTIKFVNLQTYELEEMYSPAAGPTLCVTFHPTHPQLMLSSAMDGTVTLTDLIARQTMQTMKNHSRYVVKTLFDDSGRWLASLGYDKQVVLYELEQVTLDEDEDTPSTHCSISTVSYVKRWSKQLGKNVEAGLFVGQTHFVFTCRDDNHLQYVSLKDSFAIKLYNLNELQDSHISFSILAMTWHPSKQYISLQTDTRISRIILVPPHSSERVRTIYTSAEQSEWSVPRHHWLSRGTLVALTSDDGIVRLVDMKGRVISSYNAHGPLAPVPVDDSREEAPVYSSTSEVVRARQEAERGSSIVRDITVLADGTIISVGFDKTVRIARPYI
ncbi:uncharacterized protein L969DRAFT_235362 [Mixia osmundae IAM 14324]|uniref:LisH domain-containing protein n=1 Tax=Mixia osmundae (strain CBS 9802 / IAM 14324 / JCM 22182 / KY 12970) TaxID=764103 RepID=G7E2D1_MIXOS|nr:uncharacterized protein L969DRAFT_235362 [Mixia osmundae IAM 14324]KEI36863.1 hypothetical protein L969DRAFT_235362 [Mixia osmundae IAM 14324]GAA96991.1 hypothetical protein E5Q_03665 [Mixia osmundae IAM 14324]